MFESLFMVLSHMKKGKVDAIILVQNIFVWVLLLLTPGKGVWYL